MMMNGEKHKVTLSAHTSLRITAREYATLLNQHQSIDLFLGEYAQLTIWHDQNFEYPIHETVNIRFHLDSHSRLDYSFLITGALAEKQNIEIFLHGERSHAIVRGAYLLKKKQHVDLTTIQHHQAPHTTSTLVVKGALQHQAQSIYRGTICVDQQAHHTNARQENKNILMSSLARAQSMPVLEVLTKDVQCAHGSAVGQFDEEALFYAQARGLDLIRAQRILIEGFFADLFTGNDHRRRLQQCIDQQLF